MDTHELDPDPLRQFERWFAAARAAGSTPEAMALATATPDGRPSRADGASEGRRRARLRLLHELREPQGPVSCRRTRGRRSSSTGSRSGGRCGSRGRRAARTSGVGGVLHARPLEPARRRPRRRAGRSPTAPSSSGSTPTQPSASPPTCRCRHWAATDLLRTRTSSGSTATTGCTTASATSTDRDRLVAGVRPGSLPSRAEERARGVVRVGVVRLPRARRGCRGRRGSRSCRAGARPARPARGGSSARPSAGRVEDLHVGVDRDRLARHHVADPHRVEVGASPASASTSRSVKMPTSGPRRRPRPSRPPPRASAARPRRAVSSGATVTTRVLITSRSPFGRECNACCEAGRRAGRVDAERVPEQIAAGAHQARGLDLRLHLREPVRAPVGEVLQPRDQLRLALLQLAAEVGERPLDRRARRRVRSSSPYSPAP